MSNRIVHITLEKCGSQWVRDILIDPRIGNYTNHPYSGISLSISTQKRLDLPDNSLSGPIYGVNQAEWVFSKSIGDKAIVVIRDPRDRMISYLYSLLYSHGKNLYVEAARSILLGLTTHSERVQSMIMRNVVGAMRFYLTWTDVLDESAYLLRYEDLVQETLPELKKVMDWLGVKVPKDELAQVVECYSFESRSGRSPGEEDKFSHYRKGIVGDWRNNFSRSHGQLWETLFPGFLRTIGYEPTDDWWESLPDWEDEQTGAKRGLASHPSPHEELLQIIQTRNSQLEKDLESKEDIIRDLAATCEERLNLIQTLEQTIHFSTNSSGGEIALQSQTEILELLKKQNRQLEQELELKERVIRELSSACEERLHIIKTMDEEIVRLRNNIVP